MAHNIPQHIVPFVKGTFNGGEITYNKKTNTLSGWGEYAGGYGSEKPYKVYFAASFNVILKDVAITNKGNKQLYAQLKLPVNTDVVNMSVAISMKNISNAEKFLKNELTGATLEKIQSDAKQAWEDVFSKIEVKGNTPDERRLFYTTMYHSFVMPRDRTGDNPRWDSDMPHFDDHYCIWDTWRTKYPLMILINKSFVTNTINSFIDRYKHDGECTPTFTSSLEWDWKQGGDDVDNVIADAFVKGVEGFNKEEAYELIKHNAFKARSQSYLTYGWMPETGERMSCSSTMEFTYNDFCGATVAAQMNDKETASFLMERSGNWEKLFDPNLESQGFKGFIAPRKENNEWINIDPAKRYGSWVEYFYEGNSWVYTLFTPHQFDKLIGLCGGKETMINRLIYGFENSLIEMDNEPGFLSPFIFTHCNRPDLAAKYVKFIRDNHFSLATGYPENEDSGAMGSWYIFTSIGFFPNAGQDIYYLLPPVYDEVAITMENGKKINVKTIKLSPDAKYIESVNINGKELDRAWIKHAEIAEGANITYRLTNKENAWKIK
jgi:predicted alpha-1,2-mannosidase